MTLIRQMILIILKLQLECSPNESIGIDGLLFATRRAASASSSCIPCAANASLSASMGYSEPRHGHQPRARAASRARPMRAYRLMGYSEPRHGTNHELGVSLRGQCEPIGLMGYTEPRHGTNHELRLHPVRGQCEPIGFDGLFRATPWSPTTSSSCISSAAMSRAPAPRAHLKPLKGLG